MIVLPQGILADQTGADQRESRAEFGQIDEDIIGRAASALVLAADIGELLALGIHVDQFDLVDDPVAARDNAATT
jgi:hypothetical protein